MAASRAALHGPRAALQPVRPVQPVTPKPIELPHLSRVSRVSLVKEVKNSMESKPDSSARACLHVFKKNESTFFLVKPVKPVSSYISSAFYPKIFTGFFWQPVKDGTLAT